MYSSYEQKISKRLKEIRNDKSYTQEQIAAKLQIYGCDITRSAIGKIESCQRHVTLYELKALKEVLNVTYDDILG